MFAHFVTDEICVPAVRLLGKTKRQRKKQSTTHMTELNRKKKATAPLPQNKTRGRRFAPSQIHHFIVAFPHSPLPSPPHHRSPTSPPHTATPRKHQPRQTPPRAKSKQAKKEEGVVSMYSFQKESREKQKKDQRGIDVRKQRQGIYIYKQQQKHQHQAIYQKTDNAKPATPNRPFLVCPSEPFSPFRPPSPCLPERNLISKINTVEV
ncbi:hypothetical protein QBC39DRAFT_365283 [Podospora conica]|nr:hypothetical protein QBC39DRAFT_365283 [Schizothecium conicum]